MLSYKKEMKYKKGALMFWFVNLCVINLNRININL